MKKKEFLLNKYLHKKNCAKNITAKNIFFKKINSAKKSEKKIFFAKKIPF